MIRRGIFFLLLGGIIAAASPSSVQKLVWTYVHNHTRETIHFQAGLYRAPQDLQTFTLEPGGKQHFPGSSAVKILFFRKDKPLLYRLNPGPRYYFRSDETGAVDLFAVPPVDAPLRDFVPFVVTPETVIERMLEMARLTDEDVLYDLGCGDGRIVIAAAGDYGARGVGIDIDGRRIREARRNAENSGVSGLVAFMEKNALNADLKSATVVTIYMSMQFNQKLRKLFEQDLSPGARVVAHNYAVPGWARNLVRFETMVTPNQTEHIIYLYQKNDN